MKEVSISELMKQSTQPSGAFASGAFYNKIMAIAGLKELITELR